MADADDLRPVRRRPMNAAELRRMAGLPPAQTSPQLVPPDDVRLILRALMELLQSRRQDLDNYRKGLRERYERFACTLRESGFDFTEVEDRQARADRQRRLGELAEASGNVDGAIAFYELALRSWSAIGCRRRLERLKKYSA